MSSAKVAFLSLLPSVIYSFFIFGRGDLRHAQNRSTRESRKMSTRIFSASRSLAKFDPRSKLICTVEGPLQDYFY